jgi:hypothetical protein
MRQRRKEFTPIDEIISHMLRFLMYIYNLGEYTFAEGDGVWPLSSGEWPKEILKILLILSKVFLFKIESIP